MRTRTALAGWLVFVAAAFAVLAIIPVLTIPLVAWQAQAAAAGRPYCIMVAYPPAGLRYRTATAWSDFSGSRMRAGRGQRGDRVVFHAVLYARDPDGKTAFGYVYERQERFNWSYASLGFESIRGQGHWTLAEKAPCELKTDFVRHLPWWTE